MWIAWEWGTDHRHIWKILPRKKEKFPPLPVSGLTLDGRFLPFRHYNLLKNINIFKFQKKKFDQNKKFKL